MSWKPQVQVSGNWEQNGLVFATKEEAEESARSLYGRWTLTTGWRAVESELTPNYKIIDGEMSPVTID